MRARLERALQIMVREDCNVDLWGVYVPPISDDPGSRPFTPPRLPRGAQRPHRIDSTSDLQVILRTQGVIAI